MINNKRVPIICAAICLTLALGGCQKMKSDSPSDSSAVKEIKTSAEPSSSPLVINEDSPSPSAGTSAAPSPSPSVSNAYTELTDLRSTILPYMDAIISSGGTAAVTITDLTTGDYVDLSSGQMQAASLIKIYIAGAVYENQDLLSSYGYGIDTINSYVSPMISASDNDSANTLVTMLGNGDADAGRQVVNNFCTEHGYTDSHMGRLLLADNTYDDNYTSTKDCGQFLWDIYHGTLSGSSDILNYMSQQERVNKIPAGLPAGVAYANKTGELSDVENDIAIVYLSSGAYQISVMSEYLSSPGTAQEGIASLSSIVYQYFD